uniref:Phospholipase B-like n=1 Tax=Panagrolaimus sp. JU765 TaxID=591449 RepID=A0AC34QIA7_9BILA
MRLLILILFLLSFSFAKRLDSLFDNEENNVFDDESDLFTETGARQDYRRISVCLKDKNSTDLIIVNGEYCKYRVALGRYRNAVNTTGWGVLEIETFPGFPSQLQAFAAGVAEGHLTKLQIHYHHKNTVEKLCESQVQYCKKLYKYLQQNLDWIRSQVLTQPRSNLYWKHVNLTFTQLTGIFEGYRKAIDVTITPTVSYIINPIFMIQLSGELIDLNKALNRTAKPTDDPEPSKCSGLLKIADGNTDLFFSHVAMSGYNTMNRVVKLYKFGGYNKTQVPGHTVSFSGYPAALSSADDYTLMSSGLAAVETTISVFNETYYDFVKPQEQIHCWVRSYISNQLSRTAKDWVEYFAKYNSGTYNNQWTVVDYKLFKPNQELPDNNVLWILEQIPGYVSYRDMTWFLKKFRYWPSYNIPYLQSISVRSGFSVKGATQNWWRWGYSPRARIFHRDQHKVKDIESLRLLMRYNDYQHDEFSKCKCNPPYTAEAGISARGDLNPINGTYEIPGMGHRNHGSLDYKGTSYALFKKLQIHLQGGPAYDPLPPFNWNTTDIVAPHYGQPTVWNFKPFVVEWEADVTVDF